MAETHLKKYSTSLAVIQMQTKTTLRFHLTSVRMGKINYTRDSSCWQGCGAGGPLLHCWWECKLVQPLWKSVWWLLIKLGINLFQDPSTPLLGIYPKDTLSCHRDTCSNMFIAALCIIARFWKNKTKP